MTGTSKSGPITAAKASPELIPKMVMATAIANSKLLLAAVNDKVVACAIASATEHSGLKKRIFLFDTSSAPPKYYGGQICCEVIHLQKACNYLIDFYLKG